MTRNPSAGCDSIRSANSCAGPGTGDEHEARVAPGASACLEPGPQARASQQHNKWLGHEQHCEKQATDVRLVKDEE